MADEHSKASFRKQYSEAKTNPDAQGREPFYQEMRKTMSTGGGQPIPKGKKLTTERRVLQPRDPSNGRFTYNADAGLGRKAKAHGKQQAIPVSVQRIGLGNGVIKKGTRAAVGDKTFIVAQDLTVAEFTEYMKNYDEKYGENYMRSSEGKYDSYALAQSGLEARRQQLQARMGSMDAKTFKEEMRKIDVEGKVLSRHVKQNAGRKTDMAFSDNFVAKQGRRSASEKAASANQAAGLSFVEGKPYNLSKASDKTKKELNTSKKLRETGFKATPDTGTKGAYADKLERERRKVATGVVKKKKPAMAAS